MRLAAARSAHRIVVRSLRRQGPCRERRLRDGRTMCTWSSRTIFRRRRCLRRGAAGISRCAVRPDRRARAARRAGVGARLRQRPGHARTCRALRPRARHRAERAADRAALGTARRAMSRWRSSPANGLRCPMPACNCVRVAQALHWFDRAAFFAECARVLTPGGVLAAWGYEDFVAPEGMVEPVEDFPRPDRPVLAARARAWSTPRYAGFAWPFPPLPAPGVWLRSASGACRTCCATSPAFGGRALPSRTGEDPVARHAPALAAAWGDPDDVRADPVAAVPALRRKSHRVRTGLRRASTWPDEARPTASASTRACPAATTVSGRERQPPGARMPRPVRRH